MKKKLIVMMTVVAMAAVIFAGCAAPAKDVSVEGKWYDEKGVAGTIEFKEEGKCELMVMGLAIEGDYTFDAKTAKGTITLTVEDQEQSSDFEVKEDKLTLDEVTYTMTEVEQIDVSDAVNDIVEGAEELTDAAEGMSGEELENIAEDVAEAGDALEAVIDGELDASGGMSGEELMQIAEEQAQEAATDAE